MHVLFVTSEVAPLSKVGGLGDVTAALGRALVALGVEVTILTPLHSGMLEAVEAEPVAAEIPLDFGGEARPFDLLEVATEDGSPRLLLLARPDMLETGTEVYDTPPGPSATGHLKWLYFGAAVRPACRALELVPDVIHAHYWHGALALVLDRTEHYFDDDTAACAGVLTVHNAAYQGRHSTDDWLRAGLRNALLSDWYALQDGDANLLKAGVVFADAITVVSKTYVEEIQRTEGGEGLQYVFEARGDDVIGIVNGIDTDLWNPASDPHLAASYDADDLAGKRACKTALLEELGLAPTDGPLVGVVARLAHQKGIDHLLEAIPALMRFGDLRLVVLGRGDADLEDGLREAAARRPDRIAARITFDETLSHRIHAGADMLLMPSRHEPCGLNQLIAQRYGTLPVVRLTGGLIDTVLPYGPRTRRAATGFAFGKPSALAQAVRTAIKVYRRPRSWARLVRNVMTLDLGWDAGARAYRDVYERAVETRRSRIRDVDLLAHIRLEPEAPELPAHRTIPTHFAKDELRLMVKDPHRLHARWEVQGRRCKALIDRLDDAARDGAKWELRMTETGSGSTWTVPIEGWAGNWFVEVEPHRTYRAELWMTADGASNYMLSSGEASTPPFVEK